MYSFPLYCQHQILYLPYCCKYILNGSRPFTTLTSLLGPTTLQLPVGGQHWTWRCGPAAPAAVAALERSHQPGMCKLSTLVLFRISLWEGQGGGRKGKKINNKDTNFKKNISHSLTTKLSGSHISLWTTLVSKRRDNLALQTFIQ